MFKRILKFLSRSKRRKRIINKIKHRVWFNSRIDFDFYDQDTGEKIYNTYLDISYKRRYLPITGILDYEYMEVKLNCVKRSYYENHHLIFNKDGKLLKEYVTHNFSADDGMI